MHETSTSKQELTRAAAIGAPSGEQDVSSEGATHVSVVIPCLNEATTVERCVTSALRTLEQCSIVGEVIVVDNGSSDGSAEIATLAGARVVSELRRGYGSAYLAGFAAARGEFIVMGDCDLTYDFAEIPRFLAGLEAGADLVVGDRMKNIHVGAMPWHHRYIGNPMLSGLLNLLFHTGVSDAHCGMRAFRRECLATLALRTTGMEFASEMIVRAAKAKLSIRQLPIAYHHRGGESKLSSFRDGWRHIRYLLLHSPMHLFILPGVSLVVLGGSIAATVLLNVEIFGRAWQLHTLVGGCLLLNLGAQITGLGLCAQAYATYFIGHHEQWFDRLREHLRLEHGLIVGAVIAICGLVMISVIVAHWISRNLGSISQADLAVTGATLLAIGAQVIFCSLLLSILGLRGSQ